NCTAAASESQRLPSLKACCARWSPIVRSGCNPGTTRSFSTWTRRSTPCVIVPWRRELHLTARRPMPNTTGTRRGGKLREQQPEQTTLVPDNVSGLFGGLGSQASRIAAGKNARRQMPREQLANCTLEKRDAIALLEASNVGRLPNLVPIRW